MKERDMRKTILAAMLAVSCAATAETRLTVYSGDFDAVSASAPAPGMPGFALVRKSVALPTTDGAVALTGLPVAIDAAGVRIVPRDAARRITGQRFDFATADQTELLRRAIGQRLRIQQAAGDRVVEFEGTLVSAGQGLTVRTDEGRLIALAHYTSFEFVAPPADVHAGPTLRWSVEGGGGSEEFVLDYPTGGLAWRAEYVATLAGDCRMDFSGAAQVVNRSGASFDDAALVLVAGQPNLQPVAGAPQPMMFKTESRGLAADMAMAPTPQASGEYHAYPLPGRIDLPQDSVQRVPLLAEARGVACTRRYEARSPMGYFRPATPIIDPGFGAEGEVPVVATLEFANTRAAKLGLPLPAGRLRVFTGEDFLGEAALAHTPEGRDVTADLGQAFDLTLQRTRKDLTLDDDRLGLTERIELVLRNAKAEVATVRVHESLPRWSDWRIVDASAEWSKKDAQTAVFDVKVPARGEVTVTYAVRYRWPETMKPL
jgi:hypothetical protein